MNEPLKAFQSSCYAKILCSKIHPKNKLNLLVSYKLVNAKHDNESDPI